MTDDEIHRPRFFPFGNGPVNEQGVAHYDDLIASMVGAGIKPVITLFHWGKSSISYSGLRNNKWQIHHLHSSIPMVPGPTLESWTTISTMPRS